MQSVFQFISTVISVVEVRALCKLLMFFHTSLGKPYLYGPHFVHRGIVILEYVWER